MGLACKNIPALVWPLALIGTHDLSRGPPTRTRTILICVNLSSGSIGEFKILVSYHDVAVLLALSFSSVARQSKLADDLEFVLGLAIRLMRYADLCNQSRTSVP